jgi:hypothetical protein
VDIAESVVGRASRGGVSSGRADVGRRARGARGRSSRSVVPLGDSINLVRLIVVGVRDAVVVRRKKEEERENQILSSRADEDKRAGTHSLNAGGRWLPVGPHPVSLSVMSGSTKSMAKGAEEEWSSRARRLQKEDAGGQGRGAEPSASYP